MKKMTWINRALAGTLAACSATTQPQSSESPRVGPPAPFGAVPTEAQVRHAERAMYAFCHFTINTFTDLEWGAGSESELTFNPSAFDADQIVSVIKAAGLKGIILTCKHHDGFCLWPTKTTEHNVSNSPFRNGKGDVVKELSMACRKQGLEFGVYLSPWDRNHPMYGKPGYISVYRQQISELLTQYGPIFEIWMDGANGGGGYYKGKVGPVSSKDPGEHRSIDHTTYYDWPNTWSLMKYLQPQAMRFSDAGPDLRWCGNEGGTSPENVWATYSPHSRKEGTPAMPGFTKYHEGEQGHRNGQFWMQSELDVSIRPGWFWHQHDNNFVRSPKNLMQLYLNSVGKGALFNLNIPPDRRGLVHENDASSLKAFGDHLRQTFAVNLASKAKITAEVRGADAYYAADKLIDSDLWSAWIPNDESCTPEAIIELNGEKTFNMIRLREDIRLGQRVEGVAIDAWINNQWKELAQAEAIGSCRLWRIPNTSAQKLRLRVTKSSVCPALSDFGLYLEPEIKHWDAPIAPKGFVKKTHWTILSCSFEGPGGEAKRVIDGEPATVWHTYGSDGEHQLPQEVAVDMHDTLEIQGFTYLPRADQPLIHGVVDKYIFQVSQDGISWKTVSEGEIGNLRANMNERSISFPKTRARYFKFIATHVLAYNHAVISEIGVISSE